MSNVYENAFTDLNSTISFGGGGGGGGGGSKRSKRSKRWSRNSVQCQGISNAATAFGTISVTAGTAGYAVAKTGVGVKAGAALGIVSLGTGALGLAADFAGRALCD
jgi:hypothetical protein